MIVVIKQKGESDDKLIARFKKKVAFSGLLQEFKDRTRFITHAEKRKLQKYTKKHKIELEKKRKY